MCVSGCDSWCAYMCIWVFMCTLGSLFVCASTCITDFWCVGIVVYAWIFCACEQNFPVSKCVVVESGVARCTVFWHKSRFN